MVRLDGFIGHGYHDQALDGVFRRPTRAGNNFPQATLLPAERFLEFQLCRLVFYWYERAAYSTILPEILHQANIKDRAPGTLRPASCILHGCIV